MEQRKGGQMMSKPALLVAEDCRLRDYGWTEAHCSECEVIGHYKGCFVRLATAADIPADLAAEALGMSAEQFRWATVELQNGHARDPSLRTPESEYEWNQNMLPWVEAACRVREAKEAPDA